MSEKRFTDTNDGIYDNQEKRLYKISAYEFFDCETDEVVDLLNELHNENKELKAEIEQSDLISEDIVCADIQHQLLKVTDENKTLKKENEQLKKRLEHYKEVEAMNGDGKNE